MKQLRGLYAQTFFTFRTALVLCSPIKRLIYQHISFLFFALEVDGKTEHSLCHTLIGHYITLSVVL